MPIIHSDQFFKVVSTKAGRRNYGSNPHSALLSNSPHTIDYSHATPNGVAVPAHFVAPKTNGTPILLYGDLDNALRFAAAATYRRVYRAEVYGETMTPPVVLKLKLGWSDLAQAFWNAVLAGEDLSAFPTRTAPPGTVAVFGVVRLLELITTNKA